MSQINVGSEISGQSTFIANGVTIRSNSNLSISQSVDLSQTSDPTEIIITVNDSLPSSAIDGMSVKSNDGVTNLFNISGAKIDSIDIDEVTLNPTIDGYDVIPTGGSVSRMEIRTSGVTTTSTATINKGGPVSQTTIKN